jgi:hypothetical protein
MTALNILFEPDRVCIATGLLQILADRFVMR